MAVNPMHADYLANAGVWKRSRDVLSGEDAVKAAGEEYLPRLSSQSEEEFRAYVKRASFFNATRRTAERCRPDPRRPGIPPESPGISLRDDERWLARD